MPKLIVGAGAALMVALAGIALWLDRSPGATSSNTAPAILSVAEKVDATSGAIYSVQFSDVDGKQRTLGEWQHKLLVINFWATWCAPCKEEMPIFAKLQREYGSRGLQIIGIAADSKLNVVNFSQKFPVGYPLLPDEARAIELSKRLGNRLGLLPFTIVLKPGGEPVFTRLGVITESEMRDIATKYLLK